MQKIQVLIVDDAVMVRSRLSKILATDPEIEVAGVAATGKIALAKLSQLQIDVIILDVEMPDLDGLQTLSQIRQINPKVPVIMFSTSTTTGAAATLDALTIGASDYVTKPTQLGDLNAITQYLQATLIPKIKILSRSHNHSSAPTPVVQNDVKNESLRSLTTTLSRPTADIVAIGVSTGGPNALAVLLSQVPLYLTVPIVIVQHMPPTFTKLLAERLATKCALPVQEGTQGDVLRPGTVWIAPGNYHLRVARAGTAVQLVTDQSPPQNFCRPSVDVLFHSVAQVYGDRALGVILTGMGQDGLQGCHHIRDCNGQILVQDEASSVVWGMPGFVAQAGLADAVLPLNQLMSEITNRVSWTASSARRVTG